MVTYEASLYLGDEKRSDVKIDSAAQLRSHIPVDRR